MAKKKPARRSKTAGKKPSRKKTAGKKPAAKKPAARKAAVRKAAARKPTAKKPAARKPPTRKPVAKKPATPTRETEKAPASGIPPMPASPGVLVRGMTAASLSALVDANEPPAALLGGVNQILSKASPFPPSPITACLDLHQRFGLTTVLKRALSNSLQNLARQFKSDARIVDDECAGLSVVESAYALVASKAGFTYKKVCQ